MSIDRGNIGFATNFFKSLFSFCNFLIFNSSDTLFCVGRLFLLSYVQTECDLIQFRHGRCLSHLIFLFRHLLQESVTLFLLAGMFTEIKCVTSTCGNIICKSVDLYSLYKVTQNSRIPYRINFFFPLTGLYQLCAPKKICLEAF